MSEILRTSQTGHLQEPCQIDDWWIISRLERYEPARFDQPMAETMAAELFEEWVNEQFICKMNELWHQDGHAS